MIPDYYELNSFQDCIDTFVATLRLLSACGDAGTREWSLDGPFTLGQRLQDISSQIYRPLTPGVLAPRKAKTPQIAKRVMKDIASPSPGLYWWSLSF